MIDFMVTPSISNPDVDAKRAAIEHRATWLGLIYDEARKAGVENIEEILRAAIRRTGRIHGARFQSVLQTPDDYAEMCPMFLTPTSMAAFEQTISKCEHDTLASDFGYCPFVSAWKKLDLSDEDIALLCDIAMDGDRGVADAMHSELNILKRISLGDDHCSICFHR